MINRTSTYQVLGEFGLLLRCYLTSFLPCFLVGLIHAVAKRVPRIVFDDGALHGVCLIFLLADVLHGERKLGEKHALLSLTFTGTSLACYKLVCFWWLCMLSFLFGKERAITSNNVTRAPKISPKQKNATEDESNLPHMLAS